MPVEVGRHFLAFDLFRVGTLVADITNLAPGEAWRGSMQLVDPDGAAVATTTGTRLTFEVGLPTLSRSRDAAGRVRTWTLRVTRNYTAAGGHPHVMATVIGRGRITISALRSRIDALLGPRGAFVELWGEHGGGDAKARLRINDVASAETIDMHGLLDASLSAVAQDEGVDPRDFQPHTVYTLASRSEDLGYGLDLDVRALVVDAIDVAIGPGVMLGAGVPAIRLSVAVSGALKVRFGPAILAEAKVRGGLFAVEVGIRVSSAGRPYIVTATPDSPFDIDISPPVQVALLASLGAGALLGGLTVAEYLERELNRAAVDCVRRQFSHPALAPSILMTIAGAHLTYRSIRFEGDALVSEYVAPVEPDPRPRPDYWAAIGRSPYQTALNQVDFFPLTLGDTWRAVNLSAKIDHIVVVMMENRSYDHVLGYRARPPFSDGADGLTDEMIAAIQAAPGGPFTVRALREAGFPPNALGLMTRLPKGVGHEVHDVAQQLSARAAGPGGRTINSPRGFVDNFVPRLGLDPQGVVSNDVLGFYDQHDLPFSAYLAEHYAYSDRFYCSHPGPTLPNRMYSLTGDVQHDRYGFPILDNNTGDNFLLSRAPTIYDLLVRKGLGFRVYESSPSVTMLRMFARYATDTVNIVPLDRLAADVARGDLPALTAIEPQMHAHPQDDDHPDADMHRGQLFLKRVYDALTSNPALWQRTLLIITYDEHGGFYDHVVPPPADVYLKMAPLTNELDGGLAGSGSVASEGATVGLFAETATPSTEPAPSQPMQTIPYGVRIPTFVVSPWTMRGKGPSLTLDHCSILKTVLARFFGAEKPFLSDRVHASHSFESFLTEATPRMNVPPFAGTLAPLPPDARRVSGQTSAITTSPLSRRTMRAGSVDYHALSGRWARQLGR
jgi:phospholipase C